jgi:hypothetical protein
MLKFNLKDWMPCGLVFDCFRGKYVRPAVEATWGKKFDKAFAIEEAKFIAKSKRDMDRIAQRKKERRQFGYYYNEDRWSSFSVLSEDPPYEIYNPTDGTCDGDSEHSRAYYQGEEDELEEEARMLRHMWGEYTASSSSDARDDNSEAGSSAAETSGNENSDSNLEPARDDYSAAGSDGVKSKGDEDPVPGPCNHEWDSEKSNSEAESEGVESRNKESESEHSVQEHAEVGSASGHAISD